MKQLISPRSIFSEFDPIALSDMDRVNLMNRKDTKYWFHVDCLPQILNDIKPYYFALTNGNENLFSYSNVYYDTVDNLMYTAHHNGKLNRYKVRRRRYDESDDSFLEVKFKTNKKQTIKNRIPALFHKNYFSGDEITFLNEMLPFSSDGMRQVLMNRFQRATLVSKSFDERCTFDFNLQFSSNNKKMNLHNLVIVEVKTEGIPRSSVLAKSFFKHRIKASGYSKYCMGRIMTDENIKYNRFKQKIRRLEKIVNTAHI